MARENSKLTGTPSLGIRVWPVAAYFGLIAVGIPWYWPSDNYVILFGAPGWVVIAIAVSFAASALTAWLLRRPWPGEDSARNREHVDSTGR